MIDWKEPSNISLKAPLYKAAEGQTNLPVNAIPPLAEGASPSSLNGGGGKGGEHHHIGFDVASFGPRLELAKFEYQRQLTRRDKLSDSTRRVLDPYILLGTTAVAIFAFLLGSGAIPGTLGQLLLYAASALVGVIMAAGVFFALRAANFSSGPASDARLALLHAENGDEWHRHVIPN